MESNRQSTIAALRFQVRSIGPASLDVATRSVEATLSTEAPIPMYDWQRREVVPEILLTDGVMLPRQMPLLDNHLRYTVKTLLGSSRDMRKEGGSVIGRLQFSSTAEDEFTKVREGHVTDVSVGYRVLNKIYIPEGKTRSIKGRVFTGPVNVVTKWRAYEVSLTPIGADEQAKLRGMSTADATSVRWAVLEYPWQNGQRSTAAAGLIQGNGIGPEWNANRSVKWEDLREFAAEIAKGISEARQSLFRREVDEMLELAGIDDPEFARRCHRMGYRDQVLFAIEMHKP